jgi:tRNA 2-selenouridine synthase
MPASHPTEDFLNLIDREQALLLDVRSQREYTHAHIPGAVNIPLLNDEHRHEVGITYKQKGREAAVLKGFDLVGPLFADKVREVNSLSSKKIVFVYCWRGGMRSGIMAWLLSLAGYEVHLLKNGYKSYRNWVLKTLASQRKIFVLGGQTGSGKTEVLKYLEQFGEQIIDLEGLAHHKGSAFGALGQLPQPHYEQFENMLAKKLSACDPEKITWIENESNSIGTVKIPDALFTMIREAPVLEMIVNRTVRKQRIHNEYAHFPK